MRELVRCTRFHPLGDRTFYRLGRGGHYARGLADDEWSRQANENLLVIAMIEEVLALDQLDDMLAVEGIDAVGICSKDLWQSMGMPPAHQVEEVVSLIAAAVWQREIEFGKPVDPGTRAANRTGAVASGQSHQRSTGRFSPSTLREADRRHTRNGRWHFHVRCPLIAQ